MRRAANSFGIATTKRTNRTLLCGSVFSLTVQTEPYLESHIPRPEHEAEAAEKLAALAEKTGGTPNILLLLVDDRGRGDPGSYGGGIAVGAPTPEMDPPVRSACRRCQPTGAFRARCC